MKTTHLKAALLAFAVTTLSLPAFAGDAAKTTTEKLSLKQSTATSAPKAANTKVDASKSDAPKTSPKAAASAAKAPASAPVPLKPQAPTPKSRATGEFGDGGSPLMGAFQSEEGFLVTVVEPSDAKADDVLITLVAPNKPESPRWCMMFGDAKVTSSQQSSVTVTQYQPKHVPGVIPACTVTLTADKDHLRVTGHNAECESLCQGYADAFVPKQPLVRLKR